MQDLAVRPLSSLPDLWWSPVGATGPGAGYYRPLALTILALLGRAGIPAIHVAAAGLHVASTALLHRLLRGAPGALVATAFFAVHPLAGEVLGWASALPDALAVFAALAATALAAGGRPLLAAGMLLAGVLCKETALLPLPFFALAGLVSLRTAAWVWGPAAVAVLGVRLLGIAGSAYSIGDRLALVPAAVLWSLLPWPLTAVRDLRAVPGWVVPVGAAVVLLLAVLAGRRRGAWAGLGLLLAAPVVALPPTLDGYLAAERYAYVGLLGGALWLSGLRAPSSVAVAVVAVLGAVGVGGHLWRGPQWRDDVALFSAATRALPESSYAWHFRGVVLAHAGRPAEAAEALIRAVETGHPHPQDRELALAALVEAGEAERALRWAEAGPRDALTAEQVAWWARAAAEAGHPEQARALLEMLRTEAGWDGPPWVAALAETVP